MLRKLRILILSVFAISVLGFAAAYLAVPDIKWRVDVLALKLTGRIDGIGLGRLARMIAPGSGFWLPSLAESKNPYSSIKNPFTSESHVADGASLFERQCAVCHGAAGVGNSGPSLQDQRYKQGDSDWALFKVLESGVDGTAMQASGLDDMEIWSLVAYIRTLQPQGNEDDGGISIALEPVTPATILDSDANPANWLTYSGSYDGQRFSRLSQVTPANAADVSISWIHQFQGGESIQESSPIIVDGIMFLTESPNVVHALDAATGEVAWSYTHRIPDDIIICCGNVNRGAAIWQDSIIMGTLDSRVIALDANTGKLRWDVDTHDHRLGSSISAAPLVVNDTVIVGYGGGDYGLRGFFDALDARDGTPRWRFHTIPAEGEPGNDTWLGESWKTGGAATWLTGSYDGEARRVFWTIGNPAPDHQGDSRLGDNLYSNSVVALDIDTGEMDWYFQYTPHDEMDWDSNQIPVLVDRQWRGEQRKLLLHANRNGFFYVLDRTNGEFLLGKPFAKQNWALGIDDDGRPIRNPETALSTEGKITWPSPIGATNWQSPTYSPQTGLLYVPALEYGQIAFKDAEEVEFERGELFLGGYHANIPGGDDLYYSVRALDPETGDIVWEYDSPPRPDWWKTGGLVSTAGGVIFGGDGTHIFMLDAVDGSELWRRNVGGRINASPISYAVDGVQYFAIAAGRSLIVLSLDRSALADLENPDAEIAAD